MEHEIRKILEELSIIHHKIQHIMSTQAEIAQALTDLGAQVTKIATESKATLQKVSDLEAALAKGNVSQEVQDAFNALKSSVQSLDDLVPDSTAPAGGSTTNS